MFLKISFIPTFLMRQLRSRIFDTFFDRVGWFKWGLILRVKHLAPICNNAVYCKKRAYRKAPRLWCTPVNNTQSSQLRSVRIAPEWPTGPSHRVVWFYWQVFLLIKNERRSRLRAIIFRSVIRARRINFSDLTQLPTTRACVDDIGKLSVSPGSWKHAAMLAYGVVRRIIRATLTAERSLCFQNYILTTLVNSVLCIYDWFLVRVIEIILSLPKSIYLGWNQCNIPKLSNYLIYR